MNYLHATVLSVVEGLTEFLPVSSTAHLVLASNIFNLTQTNFLKSFEIIIQLGAILAVVVVYLKELIGNPKLWLKIILAFLPSAVVGFFLYDFIKEWLLGDALVTALALIVGGIAFMVVDKLLARTNRPDSALDVANLSPKRLLTIGLFQCLAMIPGVSRSAASIFGGMLTGLSRAQAAKFSFFLAVPTMLAATSLDLYKSGLAFSTSELILLAIGFTGAFVTALLAIKVFISFVQKHTFFPFGVYRIVIGLIWLFVILVI